MAVYDLPTLHRRQLNNVGLLRPDHEQVDGRVGFWVRHLRLERRQRVLDGEHREHRDVCQHRPQRPPRRPLREPGPHHRLRRVRLPLRRAPLPPPADARPIVGGRGRRHRPEHGVQRALRSMARLEVGFQESNVIPS
eukprot:gene794-biopygen11590